MDVDDARAAIFNDALRGSVAEMAMPVQKHPGMVGVDQISEGRKAAVGTIRRVEAQRPPRTMRHAAGKPNSRGFGTDTVGEWAVLGRSMRDDNVNAALKPDAWLQAQNAQRHRPLVILVRAVVVPWRPAESKYAQALPHCDLAVDRFSPFRRSFVVFAVVVARNVEEWDVEARNEIGQVLSGEIATRDEQVNSRRAPALDIKVVVESRGYGITDGKDSHRQRTLKPSIPVPTTISCLQSLVLHVFHAARCIESLRLGSSHQILTSAAKLVEARITTFECGGLSEAKTRRSS